MKKAELIAMGLDEELAGKVETAFAEHLKGFIPKARFDEVNTEKNTLQATVKERDTQLETLKNSTGDLDKLKQEITTLQADNKKAAETHAAEIQTLKINTAVDAALVAAKAKNTKAVRALLDLDKTKLLEDGTIAGLADQLKKLAEAEDSKFLFDTEAKTPKVKGAVPADSKLETPDGKPDLSKMTYEEMAAWLEANPGAELPEVTPGMGQQVQYYLPNTNIINNPANNPQNNPQ